MANSFTLAVPRQISVVSMSQVGWKAPHNHNRNDYFVAEAERGGRAAEATEGNKECGTPREEEGRVETTGGRQIPLHGAGMQLQRVGGGLQAPSAAGPRSKMAS